VQTNISQVLNMTGLGCQWLKVVLYQYLRLLVLQCIQQVQQSIGLIYKAASFCAYSTAYNACNVLMQWEKVKKAGMAPTPRTSFALVTHKKRAIIFGGVTDQHGKGDHMFSTLHDELYQFKFDSRRWYPVAVKVSAKQLAKSSQDEQPASSNASQQSSKGQNGVSSDQGKAEGGSPGQTEAVQSAQLANGSAAQHPVQARPTDNAGGGPGVQSADGTNDAAEQSGELLQPNLADKLSRAGMDKESALYKAAARIQSRFRGYTVRKVSHFESQKIQSRKCCAVTEEPKVAWMQNTLVFLSGHAYDMCNAGSIGSTN